MKVAAAFLSSFFVFSLIFPPTILSADDDVFRYIGKIGFLNGEDKILDYKFIEKDSRAIVIGEKRLQIWDAKNAKLISSVPHEIPQFSPRGFISTYVLLELPRFLEWRPFLIDERGQWIITIEKVDKNPLKSAVVRKLPTLEKIAVLNLPDVSTEYISFSEPKNEVLTFGVTNKNGAFSSWDADRFTVKETVSVKDYKWHQPIYNDTKVLVGSGDTKFSWTAIDDKQGDTLTLRNIKNGAVEKEYTAENLKPLTSFQDTIVTNDEKYLVSKRNERVFVWEIGGNGQPKFEVSQKDPKEKFSFKSILDKKYILAKIGERICLYDIAGNGAPKLEVAPQNEKEDLRFVNLLVNRYAVIRANGIVRIYDLDENNKLKFEFGSNDPNDKTKYIDSSFDGKFFAVLDEQKISVYTVNGSEKPFYEIVRESENERFPMLTFLKDTNYLVVVRVNRSEKTKPKTQLYNLPTGKIDFEASFEAIDNWEFTADAKHLYQQGIGSLALWNQAEQKIRYITLTKYNPPIYASDVPEHLKEKPYNKEFAEFSPDYRYIVRHGNDITAVFNPETAEEMQILFDKDKAKYDKRSKIKKSGLGQIGWLNAGKHFYAFEDEGFFVTRRSINLWEVTK